MFLHSAGLFNQAATRQTLATSTELDADEQEFALRWNVWLRVHKLYRDADMADTCRAFFAHHVDLQADTPMRRCFVSHLLMLWSYRLLSPEDVQRVLRLPVLSPALGPSQPLLAAQSAPSLVQQ